MKLIITESQSKLIETKYGNDFRRRVGLLDRLIDALLPDLYPCDYESKEEFFNAFYEELFWLTKNSDYGLDKVDLGDIIDYVYLHKKEEIYDYYNERCNGDINEMINLDIKVGDVIMGGKFKNKKVVVKTIGKNDKGDITINGKPLLRFRIIK